MSRREDREANKKKAATGKLGLVARFLGETPWAIAASLFPVLADGLHWLVFDDLNDVFREMLLAPSETTILVVLGIYLAYVVSLGFIGRLEPDIKLKSVTITSYDEVQRRKTSTTTTWPDIIFFYPSFGFGIIMVLALVIVSGMTVDDANVSEGWQQFAVFTAIGIFFAHLVVKFGGIEARHPSSKPRYFFYLVPTVLISEIVLNLSTAIWYRNLGPEAGAPAPENPDVFVSFLFAAPIFLLFFAAPRFTFMSKSFTWPALASGLAFVLYELWGMVEYAPLL